MARQYGGLNRGGIRSGGKAKGTPNKVSVEARTLASELVTNPHYQERLRRDFARRKLHPTIESMVWAYHVGKPVQPVAMAGGLSLDITSRLAEERKAFAQLELRDLEQLAAESQALVDRALELARIAGGAALDAGVPPQDVVVESDPANSRDGFPKENPGPDNGYSVNQNHDSTDNDNPSGE